MSDETTNSNGSTRSDDRETLLLRHVLWRGMIAIVIVLTVGWAAWYLTGDHHSPSAHQSAPQSGPMDVKVVTITPVDVPMVSQFLAQTEASESVAIRARVSGYLTERGFEDGQVVQAGDPLFTIDQEPFKVALKRAEAGLAAAEAQLTRAEQQVHRFEQLAEVQQAAANELEQAQEAQRIAAATVETQKAEIAQAQLDLGYTSIHSPITGVIGTRRQDIGSFVGMSTDSLLATVRKVDPLYVTYSVSEQDLLRWQRMTESGELSSVPVDELDVSIVLPDGREFPHKGSIDYVDVAVDPSTGTAVIRATVPNPERTLRPGQFVHARISGVDRIGAYVIPQSAVLQTPTGSMVYVVDSEGIAQMRPVALGDWVENGWVIDSGLNAGESVIIDHLMQVRPGTSVRATAATNTAP